MTAETVVYDVQTGREEIKEVEESIGKPEIQPKSLEEKVQELQKNVLNLQSVLINQKISGGGIELTDSSALPLKGFSMQGKTEQESTTGKNLFDANEIDATRHLLGDLSGFSDVDVKSFNLSNLIPVKEGESIVKSGTTGSSVVGFLGEDKSFLKGVSLADGKSIAVPAGAFYFCCNIAVSNLKNKIQIEKGNTATTYEPYTGGKLSPSVEYPQEIVSAGDSGQIEIKVTGKNLFDISKFSLEHDEEVIIIKPADTYAKIIDGSKLEKNTRYTIWFSEYENTLQESKDAPLIEIVYTDKSKSEIYVHWNKYIKTNAQKEVDYIWFRNPWKAGCRLKRLQVEKGEKQTSYEPYKEPQTVQLQLDRSLTKWDRLEKRDDVWGIAYQTGHIESYKGESITTEYVSTTGGLDDGAEIYYKLSEPEFVPFLEETQIALNSLHTNYPTTIISNSEDCEMEVEYVADTKNYINKQIQGVVTKQINTDKMILERMM